MYYIASCSFGKDSLAMLQVIKANPQKYPLDEIVFCDVRFSKERISVEDVINSQTFPQDFDFLVRSANKVGYICGMSVPPVMIKRVVERLIESKIFE